MSKDVEAGQAIYTKPVLMIYDWWVLGFSNSFIWQHPTRHLVDLYQTYTTHNHLDIGVGTGYFLDKCELDKHELAFNTRLALMDLNPNSLAAAAKRLERFQPETYQVNILEPLTKSVAQPIPKFSSISANYLLHCLPGGIYDKAIVFNNIANLLQPRGHVFGATLLGKGQPMGSTARKLMDIYNRKGIFCNREDDEQGLQDVLNAYFEKVIINVHGCLAVFVAHGIKEPGASLH
jgi:ubiquinone/menaquinone biosynthesis C-methylase UbiE